MVIKKDSEDLIRIFNKEIKKNKKNCYKSGQSILTVSINFMRYIVSDIRFVEKIECSAENKRYIYSILRVSVEQLIIYKYLMYSKDKREELCNDFLGLNINIEELNQSDESDLEKLKALRGKRTTLYNNIFKQMASKFENVDEEVSIYNLYSMMADYVHNAYYESMLQEYNKEPCDDEFVNTIILTILGSFLETYNKINFN